MSDERFLKRWSRKKRAENSAASALPAEAPPPSAPPQAEEGFPSSSPPRSGGGQVGTSPPGKQASEEEEVDPATLPPLESLGRDSDYTVFLRKGVPEAIRNVALRKAWMSDPAIRDFHLPAEYDWDFMTSEFELRPGDDVKKMLERIFGPKPAAAAPPAETADAAPPRSEPPDAGQAALPPAARPEGDQKLPQAQAETEAAQAPNPVETPPSRRKHGGAIPD